MHSISSTSVTVGVDTHADVHVAAVLDQLGRRLGTLVVPSTPRSNASTAPWPTAGPSAVFIERISPRPAGLFRHCHHRRPRTAAGIKPPSTGLITVPRSVEQWRRAWREGGSEGLRSAGPANSPTVTEAQFAVLEEELAKGPSAHGFEDQRWTLARVQTVVRRRLRLSLSVATVWRLLKRHGWSWQPPARRAFERDEHAVELWKKEVRPQVKGSRRRAEPGSSSRTKPASR